MKIIENRTLERIAYFATVLIFTLAILAIVGWHIHDEFLIQINPTFAPMQYNSALCFLLFAGGLILELNGKRRLSFIVAAAIFTIATITGLQYLLNLNLGIDEFFMKSYIMVDTSHPGRMGLNTSLCFILSSVAISLLQFKRTLISGSIISAFIIGFGVVSFVGYLVGSEYIYSWGAFSGMSINAAIGFILLGTALIIECTKREKTNPDKKVNIKLKTNKYVGYATALALTVFLIDISVPKGVAASELYVFLVLIAYFFKNKYTVFYLALAGSILSVIGYFLSSTGVEQWIGNANRMFAIATVWLTAFLVYIIKSRDEVLIKSNLELDQKVKVRTDELEARNQELEQFAYVASHDLQEPLRTVAGFATRFKKKYGDQLDEKGIKYLDFMLEGTERMSTLISELLNYSRLGVKQSLVQVNCNTLIKELLVDMDYLIKESNSDIQVSTLPIIYAYKSIFSEIFLNLITNAIKFQKKENTPIISISWKRNAKDDYQFIVKDNGIGIEKDGKEKIFKIFQRLNNRDEFKGTGIGLAHCRKIVEMHKGEIWVESEIGQGSTFNFTVSKNLSDGKKN